MLYLFQGPLECLWPGEVVLVILPEHRVCCHQATEFTPSLCFLLQKLAQSGVKVGPHEERKQARMTKDLQCLGLLLNINSCRKEGNSPQLAHRFFITQSPVIVKHYDNLLKILHICTQSRTHVCLASLLNSGLQTVVLAHRPSIDQARHCMQIKSWTLPLLRKVVLSSHLCCLAKA